MVPLPIKLLVCLLLILQLVSVAQDDYANQQTLRYHNHCYKSNIKTILLEAEGAPLSFPMYDINSNVKLIVRFDDLDADFKNYNYTVEHCDANWQPSNIPQDLYVKGFNNEPILNYKTSFNTLVKYTHYTFSFPNENMQLLITGNYLLKIVDRDYPDNFIFVRRFLVFENRLQIKEDIHRPVNPEFRREKQEIDFVVNTAGLTLPNPYTDLKVKILQNDNWNTALETLRPLYVKQEELEYNYESENLFNGGNQFRWFDIRSIRYHGEGVNTIEYNETEKNYAVQLFTDNKRSADRYVSDNDINGNYLIKYNEGSDDHLMGDYVSVTFRLKVTAKDDCGNIYVHGALSAWEQEENNRMKYDSLTNTYTRTLLLKQGYYNYLYTCDGNESLPFDIEGNHWETENNYMILVYNMQPGKRYYELLGVRRFNSLRIY
ncbi:MAG: DUF5103 domain-containing protein [Bacteroidetes bacterium]|nr:DUF5103 domain-containing protein [Bacteroidota bacterium]